MQNFPGAQVDQNNWIDMSAAREDEDLSAPCSGRTYDVTGEEWGAFAGEVAATREP